jgi:hypothetical protein
MSASRSTQTGGSTTPSKTSKTAPHIDQSARDALDDRGLIDNDNTEDMRTAPAYSSVGALDGGRADSRPIKAVSH